MKMNLLIFTFLFVFLAHWARVECISEVPIDDGEDYLQRKQLTLEDEDLERIRSLDDDDSTINREEREPLRKTIYRLRPKLPFG